MYAYITPDNTKIIYVDRNRTNIYIKYIKIRDCVRIYQKSK